MFSPTFFGETLFTVSRDYRGQLPYTGGAEIASTLGLPNPFNGIGFPRIPYSMTTNAGGAMSYCETAPQQAMRPRFFICARQASRMSPPTLSK